MLGLVLAIGLVLTMQLWWLKACSTIFEEGLAPKDAALKAMKELSGRRGIALVLASVFVPYSVHPRHHREALSAIRPDHRHFCDSSLPSCAHAQPGARSVCCCDQNQRKAPTSTADFSGNFLTHSIAIGNAVLMVLCAGPTR